MLLSLENSSVIHLFPSSSQHERGTAIVDKYRLVSHLHFLFLLTIDDDDSCDNQKSSIHVSSGKRFRRTNAQLEADGVRVQGEKRAEEDRRQVRRDK
jgi:hypothetical protein